MLLVHLGWLHGPDERARGEDSVVRLIEAVLAGESVTIARAGKPAADLVAQRGHEITVGMDGWHHFRVEPAIFDGPDAEWAQLIELHFHTRHASGLKQFPTRARHDPFDRMLLYQAHCDDLPLLTSDRHLLVLDLAWVVDARE